MDGNNVDARGFCVVGVASVSEVFLGERLVLEEDVDGAAGVVILTYLHLRVIEMILRVVEVILRVI